MPSPQNILRRLITRLDNLFGRGLVLSMGAVLAIGLTVSLGVFIFFNTAAPTTLTITSGPAGSSFSRNAEKYQKILAREGVTLKILPSEGSTQNLQRLLDPKAGVDVGFVLGGEVAKTNVERLMSLGSINYQPLMIFYQGQTRQLLSEFKGARGRRCKANHHQSTSSKVR